VIKISDTGMNCHDITLRKYQQKRKEANSLFINIPELAQKGRSIHIDFELEL
jgi:hypothetical protein